MIKKEGDRRDGLVDVFTDSVSVSAYSPAVIGFQAAMQTHGEVDEVYVGTLNCYMLNAFHPDIEGEADAVSGDVYEAGRLIASFGDALFDEEPGIGSFWGRVFFVESVVVDPEWRGIGLGLAIMKYAIRILGYGADTILVMPCPIGECSDREAARKKLAAYWSKLDFVPIRDTGYMGINRELVLSWGGWQ